MSFWNIFKIEPVWGASEKKKKKKSTKSKKSTFYSDSESESETDSGKEWTLLSVFIVLNVYKFNKLINYQTEFESNEVVTSGGSRVVTWGALPYSQKYLRPTGPENVSGPHLINSSFFMVTTYLNVLSVLARQCTCKFIWQQEQEHQ